MNNALENLLNETQNPEEWLDVLKPYQKRRIEALVDQGHDYEEIGEIWMGTALKDNSPFSAQPDQNRYYNQLVKETRKFLCGNSEYEENRQQLSEVTRGLTGKEQFVAYVSGILGAKLGLAVAFIAPVIVMCIIAACKISVNAWCNLENTTTDSN